MFTYRYFMIQQSQVLILPFSNTSLLLEFCGLWFKRIQEVWALNKIWL